MESFEPGAKAGRLLKVAGVRSRGCGMCHWWKARPTVFGRKSLRFGLRYVVRGTPTGAPADMRFVTRFPEGGLSDPVVGVRHYEGEYVLREAIGTPAYREYRFDHSWDIGRRQTRGGR